MDEDEVAAAYRELLMELRGLAARLYDLAEDKLSPEERELAEDLLNRTEDAALDL